MAKKNTGRNLFISGVVIAAAGGIGYLIWKKMKEKEETDLSGLGAARTYLCPPRSHLVGIADGKPPCCVDVPTEIHVPEGTKCPHGYATFSGGTFAGTTICNATSKYLRMHCVG